MKEYFPFIERWIDDLPTMIFQNGKPVTDPMQKLWLDEADIMKAARQGHGIEQLEQTRYAVAESGGEITIVPR